MRIGNKIVIFLPELSQCDESLLNKLEYLLEIKVDESLGFRLVNNLSSPLIFNFKFCLSLDMIKLFI